MASTENKHERIHKACLDLELALANFESNIVSAVRTNDSDSSEDGGAAADGTRTASNDTAGNLNKKADKIYVLKQKLIEIRLQLDQLSI